MTHPSLRLRAESSEDITVLSAALQDAILRVGEIYYSAKGRYLTLRLSRFKHENQKTSERVLTGLRFDGILKIKSRNIDRSDPEAMMVLLALQCHQESENEDVFYNLIFAGGGQITVQAECIDVTLADVQAPRKTDKLPLHPVKT